MMPATLLPNLAQVWLVVEPVDMRTGIDGLSQRIQTPLDTHNGKVLAVEVNGKLIRQNFERFVRQGWKHRPLFDMTALHSEIMV